MLMSPVRRTVLITFLTCSFVRAAEVTHVYFGTTTSGALDAIRRGPIEAGFELPETLVPDTLSPWAVALDLAAHRVYWTQPEHVRRADLHGGAIEDLYTSVGSDFRGIALDLTAGFVYWSDGAGKAIYRAGLDGAAPQSIYIADDPDAELGHLALDVSMGLIYWAEGHAIRRANFDGSAAQTIVSGLIESAGVALDLSAGKIYWTDARGHEYGAVGRANLDGTDLEDITPTVYCFDPEDIKVDPPSGKFFRSDRFGYAILRANLDGTDEDWLPFALFGYTRGIAPAPNAALLSNYPLFYDCLAGPGVQPCQPPPGECDCWLFDPDHDSDVDLRDFSLFQRFYSPL